MDADATGNIPGPSPAPAAMMPVHAPPRTPFPLRRGALNLRCMDAPREAPVEAPGDDALMQAWSAGDAMAFETLYRRHRDRLHRFLLRQLGDPGLADEVFQDTWQRVVAAGDDWRPDAAFATWLYRIARNRVADHWRAHRHRPPAPADAEERTLAMQDPDTPELRVASFERQRALRQALDALPEAQREVVLLRVEQELGLDEIAGITGVGRETVKSRLRYAMDKLRCALAGPAAVTASTATEDAR